MASEHGLLKYSKDLDRTRYYLEKLIKLSEYLSTLRCINYEHYQNIIKLLPGPLASKLRLVPDERLSARLSHLNEITTTIVESSPIGPYDNYYLISIEGSNANYSMDMDVIIEDKTSGRLICIDFTSSRDDLIINRKLLAIESKIKVFGLVNSVPYVHNFNQVSIPIDIQTPFMSKQPGTHGLKFIDMVSNFKPYTKDLFLSRCSEVMSTVNSYIATKNLTDHEKFIEPNFRETKMNESEIVETVDLLSSQRDYDSYNYIKNTTSLASEEFMKGLRELTKNARKLKPTTNFQSAAIDHTRDLKDTLSSLSENKLANTILSAMMVDKVVAYTFDGNTQLLDSFPSSTNESYLDITSNYMYCVKHRKAHVFKILFHPDAMDEKLRRILIKDGTKKQKKYFKLGENEEITDSEVDKFFNNCIDLRNREYKNLMSLTTSTTKDSIWDKILSISALASNDQEAFSRSTVSMLEATVKYVKSLFLGSCISHEYEAMKTIAASLRASPTKNDYYIGVNASFRSVSVIKMNSTLDSFERTCYSVIFQRERTNRPDIYRFKTSSPKSSEIIQTQFYSIDSNQLAYKLKFPMIFTSLLTWQVECNIDNGRLSNEKLPSLTFDSYNHSAINSDPFAQASEQVRYFYMSAIGYGGNPLGIIEKTTFLNIKRPWEFLYMLRSYKMSLGLYSLNSSSNLGRLVDHSNSDKELKVCFPHTSFPVVNFNQTVSSMYLCNVFNKFRAFHEVSEAICFNELVGELNIYKTAIKDNEYRVSGLSPILQKAVLSSSMDLIVYITSNEFVKNEVDFAIQLAKEKPNRYSGSLVYIIGSSHTVAKVPTRSLDDIYKNLSSSPIESCTMRGAMKSGVSKEENQGIRAASSMLEELISDFEMDPKDVNKSPLGSVFLFDKMKEKYYDFSLFNKVLLQYVCDTEPYRYRIVQKDQKGHREISVLNATFRIGALFVETVARVLSQSLSEVDLVNNPEKDMIIESEVKTSFEKDSTQKGAICYDNSDQKRWGPNHNMNFFAASLFGLLSNDSGMVKMCLTVFDKVFMKKAKLPESLIKLVMKKNMVSSNSEPISKFISTYRQTMMNKIFEEELPMGMCQGIFHAMSSVHHAVMAKTIELIVKMKFPGVIIRKSMTTSDDAMRIIYIPQIYNKVEVIKFINISINSVGNLFNIIRNNSKSSFNFHIAELNSIFIKQGKLSTPALKQRISKIDAGSGINHIEDYLSALANSASYISNGGSYMGTYILSILNLTIHTEQWLRWSCVTSDNYYKPVEMGGFPVIEPLTTITCGAVSNLYLRSSRFMTTESYSKLYTHCVLTPPEEVSLADFTRTGKGTLSLPENNATIYKSAGPLGLFQMIRTDKKLSQFERRHKMSQWPIPDEFINLNRYESDASSFLFSIYRNAGLSVQETSLGVNSFFVKFVEPWVSFDRRCFRISANSPFADFLGSPGTNVSHREVLEKSSSFNISDATFRLLNIVRSIPEKEEYRIMNAQLIVRLNDANEISNYLKSQEAESFKIAANTASIRKVKLKGHSALGTDTYFYNIIKVLSGIKCRDVINQSRKMLTAYDDLTVTPLDNTISLKEAVIQADNSTALFEKFIRRDTKMIISGNTTNLTSLITSCLKTKFTETLGLVTSGTLKITGDRDKAYSHNHWTQELLDNSKNFENEVANSILSNTYKDPIKIGIASSRPLISDAESFELTKAQSLRKSKVINATSRDSFFHSIKMWMSADVRVMMTNPTIEAFISNKLTFAHDYYVGSGKFIRYPRDQYFKFYCNGVKGMHMIIINSPNFKNKSKTTYRHHIIFPTIVYGQRIEVIVNPEYKDVKWVNSMAYQISNEMMIKTNKWTEIIVNNKTGTQRKDLRKNYRESDFFNIMQMTPGMEMDIVTAKDSLCIMLDFQGVYLPVTYLTPKLVEKISIGYKLTHADLKIATDDYVKLRTITNNFELKLIKNNRPLIDLLNFIIASSSIDTKPKIIYDSLISHGLATKTSYQLDILRTLLISSDNIGVNIANSRFNQFLLNMGQRRQHNHNYFSRTITGHKVEVESVASTEINGDEAIIDTGFLLEKNVTLEELLKPSKIESWADEVIDAQIPIVVNNRLAVESMQVIPEESYNELFEDSVSNYSETAPALSETNMDFHNSNLASNVSHAGSSSRSTKSFKFELEDLDNINMDDFDMLESEVGSNTSLDDLNNLLDNTKMETLNKETIEDISKKYGKIEYEASNPIASVVTNFTVNPILENAKSITEYLNEWLTGPGRIKQFSMSGSNLKNIAQIGMIYVTSRDFGVDSSVNILKNVMGHDDVDIPIELSALTVINEMYIA